MRVHAVLRAPEILLVLMIFQITFLVAGTILGGMHRIPTLAHRPLLPPLYSGHSPERSRSRTDYADSGMEGGDWDRVPIGSSRLVDLEANGGDPFVHSEGSKQCRKIGSSSNRGTDSAKLGRVNPVKSGVSLRRSTSKITD